MEQWKSIEITCQRDSQGSLESPVLPGRGVDNYENDDNLMPLPLWKTMRRLTPNCHSMHNQAEVQGLSSPEPSLPAVDTCHSFLANFGAKKALKKWHYYYYHYYCYCYY